MPSIRAAILVAVGIALLFGGWWATFARPVVFCRFLQEDSIDAAFCGTYDKLGNYEAHPEETLDWLLAYHGEAPSQQVMITFVDWAQDNPQGFVEILGRLDDENAPLFLDRVVFAITDSVELERFTRVFSPRRDENSRLRELLERLEGAAKG